MPPILHDEIENNSTLLLTNKIGPKLKMCIRAFSYKSFSPFHIPRATFVNLLYDEITIFLDDSNSRFEDSRGWKLAGDFEINLSKFWPFSAFYLILSRCCPNFLLIDSWFYPDSIRFYPDFSETNFIQILYRFIENLLYLFIQILS